METGLAEVLACAFPQGVLDVAPLTGGLTNDNHRVETATGRCVLRCWRDDTGLLAIDREAEHANTVRAARTGVGPEVLGWHPECNAMVVAWIDGATLSAEALRTGEDLDRVADACRRLHAGERFVADFDMFAVSARYRRVVTEHGFGLPGGYDDWAGHLAAIRDALRARPGATVPCHNDLLAENLMLAGGRVRLIDFEYAGNNDPLFELGNLASESALGLPHLERLVASYLGGPSRRAVARARLWGLVALYGWTLWGAIQAGSSPLDFDFRAWAAAKYERAVAGFSDPGFAELLREAARQP